LLLLLGWRPGGELAVQAYRLGPLILGGASAVVMLIGLSWCLRRRPFLQRRRLVPLSVLAANLWLCSIPIAYPSSHEGHPSSVRFRLPFEGTARVRFGGESKESNLLVFDPSRRFGTCFEPLPPAALSVVAPAPGRVVKVGEGRFGAWAMLELATGEYLVLDGLAFGSFTRAPGAEVAAGEALGQAPAQLLVHLQDCPEPGTCEGIPARFWGFSVDGRAVESGVPQTGQRVAALEGGMPPPGR